MGPRSWKWTRHISRSYPASAPWASCRSKRTSWKRPRARHRRQSNIRRLCWKRSLRRTDCRSIDRRPATLRPFAQDRRATRRFPARSRQRRLQRLECLRSLPLQIDFWMRCRLSAHRLRKARHARARYAVAFPASRSPRRTEMHPRRLCQAQRTTPDCPASCTLQSAFQDRAQALVGQNVARPLRRRSEIPACPSCWKMQRTATFPSCPSTSMSAVPRLQPGFRRSRPPDFRRLQSYSDISRHRWWRDTKISRLACRQSQSAAQARPLSNWGRWRVFRKQLRRRR